LLIDDVLYRHERMAAGQRWAKASLDQRSQVVRLYEFHLAIWRIAQQLYRLAAEPSCFAIVQLSQCLLHLRWRERLVEHFCF